MLKKVKVKGSARHVKDKRTARHIFWKRIWRILSWPFRMIVRLCRKVWSFVCGIDLVGLVNFALLVAIIVLFSVLIMNILEHRNRQIVVIPEPVPVTAQVSVVPESAPEYIMAQRITLPIATDSKTHKRQAPSVNVVPVKKSEVAIAKQQNAIHDNMILGDIIIDSRGAGAVLQPGTQVNGNLYLQYMRKYTLPCDIRINGNLFLRDVNMLHFCGDFVITGNIYVSPRSSFGPIPKTAKLGGHVVL